MLLETGKRTTAIEHNKRLQAKNKGKLHSWRGE